MGASSRASEHFFGTAFAALAVTFCALASVSATVEDVRQPMAAGSFYPLSQGELRAQVEGLLRDARPDRPTERKNSRPTAIVVPHAAYRFSGDTAALCYKLLDGTPPPSRVVLLGPSHHLKMAGSCNVADFSAYSTPLGQVRVDRAAADRLLQTSVFHRTKRPHAAEHCLEVQLPFLQTLWPDCPPVVPILTGTLTADQARSAAAGLAEILDEEALLVVSTDFTHYGPRFSYAPFAGARGQELKARIRELDMGAVDRLKALAPLELRRYLVRRQPTICGSQALLVLLELLQGTAAATVFQNWSNSGETTGSYSDCVSYVAMTFYAPPGAVAKAEERLDAARTSSDEAPSISAHDRRFLLKLSRDVVRKAHSPEEAMGTVDQALEQEALSETLCSPYGVFVALKADGRLRGTAGSLTGDAPLCRAVPRMALSAAANAPKAHPIRADELRSLEVSVNVLGPILPVSDMSDIRVGRDGLVVQKRERSGVILPQTPVENGWDREQFLANACERAGLASDAWRSDSTTVLRFSATVFQE